MIHFQLLNGTKAGTAWVARRFPFRIGRGRSADLCLDEPGIWEQHLELILAPDRSVQAIVFEPALASLNGQPIREALLRNGDVLEIGALQLRFGLSPTRQRGLRFRESLTWIVLAALCLGQVLLIYWLD